MPNHETANLHVDQLLSSYLDRMLGGQEMARIEAHLETCDQCRAKLEQMRTLDAKLRRLRDSGELAQLAPLVMRDLGVSSGEGGRVVAGAPTTRHRHLPHLQGPVAWAARVGFSILMLAVIAILGLFVMARIRELPQAPLPDTSINAVSFEGNDMIFHLNATSYQGIRDLQLNYWYDPSQKLSQTYHYEMAQPEIELSARLPNQAAGAYPNLARVVFYQWTLIEKSGRETTLPVRYTVYSGPQAAQPWHAITTTHTIIYFTDPDPTQIRDTYAPVVEDIYSRITGDLGLSSKLMQSIYLTSDGRANIYGSRVGIYGLGQQQTPLAMISLQEVANPRQIKADLASGLTYNLLQETYGANFNSNTFEFLRYSLPDYMSQQYLAPSPVDAAYWLDSTRGNNIYDIYNQSADPNSMSDIFRMRDLAFLRYLIDTYGKDKLAKLLELLKDPQYAGNSGVTQAMAAVYGIAYNNFYRNTWWPNTSAALEQIQQQRAAVAPSLDLTKNLPKSIWQYPNDMSQLERIIGHTVWSPDSKSLLYSGPYSAVYIVLYDGTTQWFMQPDFTSPNVFGWSPDGKWLFFTRNRRNDDNNLYIAPVDQLKRQQPTRGFSNNNFGSDPTGGGREFQPDTGRNFSGRIEAAQPITVTTGFSVMNAAWLPDGKIVFSGRQGSDPNQLYVINSAAITQTPGMTVTVAPLLDQNAIPGDAILVAASPDGKRLAVIGQQGLSAALYIVDLGDQSQVKRVLDLGDTWIEYPSFSPDGSQLAYSRADDANGYSSYVLNLQNDKVTRIGGEKETTGKQTTIAGLVAQYDLWPTWIDNNWLIFSSTRNGGYDLYATQTSTGQLLQLSSGTAQYLRPIPSPDGKHLSFLKLDRLSTTMFDIPFDSSKVEKR